MVIELFSNSNHPSLATTDSDESTNEANGMRPTMTEFHQLITNSAHLSPFVNTILNDYRYLLNKKEIYEFIQLVLPSYMLNLKASHGPKDTSQSATTSKSVTASALLTRDG